MKNTSAKSSEIPFTAIIIGFVFAILSITHAVKTRTPEEFIKYSLFIIVPFAVLNILFWFFVWSSSGFAKLKLDDFWTFLVVILVIIAVGPVYYSCGVYIKDSYLWLRDWSQSPTISKNGVIIVFILIALFSGLVLFFFRLRFRSIYGLTEALAGLVVAANRVANANEQEFGSTTFYIAFVTAAIYLVVRGLDNIHQGFIKEPLDPLARRILKRVNRK